MIAAVLLLFYGLVTGQGEDRYENNQKGMRHSSPCLENKGILARFGEWGGHLLCPPHSLVLSRHAYCCDG